MRVRWTKRAARDLTHICDYISEHGTPAAARHVALSIYESTLSLSQFPERGRPGRKPGTRELIFSNSRYLAIYRLRTEAVEILRILHGAQKWP
ncbi:MAG TPA: type II toxin-antitoxin system RelE/ParE family toxin [Candidatus Acidoferrum sp.]|nr:type II toxin-antitoxin system RelE/ParE family toxin [Candidatus Acidoferrum sp.]